MPKRMLQVLGGLLAVAVLAVVVPSLATGDSAPTATSANQNCDDNGPWSRWGHNWWDRDNDGRYWNWGNGNGYFNGNSDYGHCDQYGSSAGAAQTGKVARVMVAAKRLHSSGCQHMTQSGHLSSLGSCSPTHWMRAKGIKNWRFDIAGTLPRGNYRLHRRAVDTDGNRERTHLLHLRIR